MSGERGPKPMPPNLRLLNGNAGKKRLGSLLDEAVRPDVEIPECPPHLDGEARAEWELITPHLYKLGLIARIDRAALTIYCEYWSDFVWARKRINELENTDPHGMRGRVTKTPSGYEQISVLQQIKNRALDGMARSLAMFGMSPADRTRVTQSDSQIPLPGMDPPKAGGWAAYQ
jgi:P27 family predicted phage terminase small subunit